MEGDEMGGGEMAMLRARRALYGLLARLLLAPPDAALLAELAGLPGFAEALPRTPDPEPDLDSLQIAYEQIFGRSVYPYESLYVDRELMLNTAAADRAAGLYAECGFAPSAAAGAPDHLGLELGLMAHLLALEIAARDAGDPATVAWSRAQQARCLHAHLARWAPICLRAVERVVAVPLYLAVARLALDLILGDLGHLPPPRSPLPTPPSPLPTPEDRGLSQVVRMLITPDVVGVFLSRGDLGALGRRVGLPAPIGERFQMLRGLFEGAGRFELVVPLIDALDALFATEAGALAALANQHPAWADTAQGWLARVAHGRALLGELRAEAGAGTGGA
jgi:TorA maturation chaperone TorD